MWPLSSSTPYSLIPLSSLSVRANAQDLRGLVMNVLVGAHACSSEDTRTLN